MTTCYYCEADDDACKTCIHSNTYIDPQEEITKLREQVQAQAAVIELYEQALIASWPEGAMGDAFDYWNQARAATDSTQILAEVRRAERERVAQMFEESGIGGDHLAAAIRAME